MAFHKQLRAGVVIVNEIARIIIGKADRQHYKKLVKNEVLTV
jgi:hypothetical protein